MSDHDGTLRIGVDARCLNVEHVRGMGRYLFEVIARISKCEDVEWHLFADRPEWPLYFPASDHVTTELFEFRGYRFHSWEQIGLPWRVRRANVDLLFCPGMRLPWLQPVPTVVTMHDAVPWLADGAGYREGFYRQRLTPWALRKCAAVITVSECSGRDLVRLWPTLQGKLHVIPNGVSDRYLEAKPDALPGSLRACGVRQPYLVYVGGEIPRKRLDWAIQVLEAMGDRQLQLVIVGVDKQATPAIERRTRPELRAQLVFAPFLDESDMPSLYQHAVAVLYPTLYEGFGFPALEAQAVGTPVLFSDVGSLSELTGPGAEVLPTHDLQAWLAVCRRLLSERRDSPRPNETARQWARRFSWDECASRHWEVLRHAAAGAARATNLPKWSRD